MAKADLTAQRLRELLNYDPETGVFTWRSRRCNNAAGTPAGYRRPDGYLTIRLDKKLYRANRLAWFYMTGGWPENLVDHKDRNPGNDKWQNLREATHSQNHQNQVVRKDCTHGHRGIALHERGLWRAQTLQGKRIHIGYFRTPEEALIARIAAERLHFTHSPACEPQVESHDARVQLDAIASAVLRS